MKAPAADQKALLKVQELDMELARLGHQLRSLPQIEARASKQERVESLEAELVGVRTELSDAKRVLTKAEDEVGQVELRIATQKERLDTGQGGPKQLQAIQAELDQLDLRKNALEDASLEAMENVEKAESKLASLEAEQSNVQSEIDSLTKEIDDESNKIEVEKAEVLAQREALVAPLDPDLVDEYERIRASTGGVGVVAVSGVSVVGMDMEFSMAEASRIKSAAPDDVITSDEWEYILVRVN